MEITNTYRGRTVKQATVIGTTIESSADDILEFVMAFFGETKGRLFGWSVEFYDDGESARVSLHTD